MLTVRQNILRHWCDYFCKMDSKKYKKAKKLGGRFAEMPGTLFSLIFLFYQSTPSNIFERFLKPYKVFVDSLNITLAGEDIEICRLWNRDNLFRVNLPLSDSFINVNDTPEQYEASTIHIDRINRFPHRMINVKSIQKEDGNLSYYLRLQTSENEIRAIKMNDGARLYDYINIFDSQGLPTNFDSIQKKVFKPDSRYMNLLVPCLPHTFRKGRNMQSDLDYCIGWYILSPFDYKSTKILSQGIPNGRDVLSELKESVLAGEQLKKCISYIMKKRFADCSDQEAAIKVIIIKEYIEFVEHFFKLLISYSPLKKPSDPQS